MTERLLRVVGARAWTGAVHGWTTAQTDRARGRSVARLGLVLVLAVAASVLSGVAAAGAATGSLAYSVYDGSWGALPDFAALEPAARGSVDRFDLDAVRGSRSDRFGVRYQGCLAVPAAGGWTFAIRSDDGSRLTVDGVVAVDNDGAHPPQEIAGSVTFAVAGRVPILVDYFELDGMEALDVVWEGPGHPRAPVPTSALVDGPCPLTGTTTAGAGTVAGGGSGALTYAVYDGSWDALPDFAALTPAVTGAASTFALDGVRGGRSDRFAVRFRGCLAVPAAGGWTFAVRSDDGSRLTVDGLVAADNDGAHPPQEVAGRLTFAAAGRYEIVVDYFELGGGETLDVSWAGPDGALVAIPAAALVDGPCPLTGQTTPGAGTAIGGGSGPVSYALFDGSWSSLPDFAALTPAVTGSAAAVDLDAVRAGRSDGFGVRFAGCLSVPAAGTWTFFLRSDDGSRLSVGGIVAVDNDGAHPPQEQSGAVAISAPGPQALLVDYFELGGGETLELAWAGPGRAREPVPAGAFVAGPCSGSGGGGVGQAPGVTSPGDQRSTVGRAVTLHLAATAGGGDTVRFAQAGLPPGLTLTPGGVVGGTPTAAGTYPVTITVSNSAGTSSTSFVWTVSPAGASQAVVQLLAGRRFEGGDSGDGGPAGAARFLWPQDVAVDSAGDVYVADLWANRVRRIDAATGIITAMAGTGTAGSSGDGGPAAAAQFDRPMNVAVDPAGNLLVADWGNQRIRRVDRSTGLVATVAGSGLKGFAGDGGPATAAALDSPEGMAFDAAGNLFFCDFGNNRVRRVDARTGTISTVAGRGAPTSDGDGGPATLGGINGPTTVQVDGSGTLFVADFNGQRIRRIDGATRTITTVAGDGTSGFAGDGGPATAARFYNPEAVLLDRATGDLYVSDAGNGRIRRIDAATGTVSTVAGGGSSLDGDVAAASASLAPLGLALHPGSGTLLFTEPYYGILRQVTGLVPPHGSP